MANKCLVTKLKAVVQNDNLNVLDTLKLYGIAGVSTTKNNQFTVNPPKTFHYKVVSGTSPISGSTEGNFTNGMNIIGGDYTLYITKISDMDAIMLYGSAACYLNKILEQCNKNNFVNFIFNDKTLLDDSVNLSKINGANVEIIRNNEYDYLNILEGDIASLGTCIKIKEFSTSSTKIYGSVNEFANQIYPTRDYSNNPLFTFNIQARDYGTSSIYYNNGSENIYLNLKQPYSVVFKNGGWELRKGQDGTGELLYDSLA